MNEVEARDLVNGIKANLADCIDLATRLFEGNGHLALGYPTFRAMAEAEFGQLRFQIEERRAAVAELTAAGMSTRQVAAVVGASQRTVADDVRSEQNCSLSYEEPEDGPPAPYEWKYGIIARADLDPERYEAHTGKAVRAQDDFRRSMRYLAEIGVPIDTTKIAGLVFPALDRWVAARRLTKPNPNGEES